MSPPDLPPPQERPIHFLSPEARRKAAAQAQSFSSHSKVRRGWEVLKRVVIGAYNDGFIHAGNLAYLSVLAIFPFFILGGAIFSLFGEQSERIAMIDAVLVALPPMVSEVIKPVAREAIEARSGWLLWAGAAVGLWTVGSLIETVRDILRRAYGTEATQAFWKYRLFSAGLIIAAVILLLLALIAQVLIGATQEFVLAYIPWLNTVMNDLSVSRLVTTTVVFGSIYLLFFTLTPGTYRGGRYPKWPGALVTTLWWAAVTQALPPVLRSFFTYDLTYGALSGIMIALFFFWLVGLGMVVGAELNAALAVTPEEESASKGAETELEGSGQ